MSSLRPDAGYYLLDKFGKESSQNFYSIPINVIYHVAENLYSTSLNTEFDDEEYAISFDFDSNILKQILSRIENKEQRKSLEKALIKPYKSPEKYQIDEIVIPYIKAKLGEPVQGQYEVFLPLVVEEVG